MSHNMTDIQPEEPQSETTPVAEDLNPAEVVVTPTQLGDLFADNFSLALQPLSDTLLTVATVQQQIMESIRANKNAVAEIQDSSESVKEVFSQIPSYKIKVDQMISRMKQNAEKISSLKQNAQKLAKKKEDELDAVIEKRKAESELDVAANGETPEIPA